MVRNQGYTILFTALLALGPFLIFLPDRAQAGALDRAKLTRVVQDVQLADRPRSRAAILNDWVGPATPLRTGANSWAELTFANQSIARLGQNSVFSFNEGTRQLDFAEGAMLLQIPKSAKGSRIKIGGVAAEISNTTCVCEFRSGTYKFLSLRGTARLYRPGHLGDSVLVRAGQMVFGQSGAPLSDPVDFDIGRFSKTSRFLLDFPSLQSAALIARESERQQRSKSGKRLIETNLVIFGRGTAVSVLNATPAQEAAPSPATAGPGSEGLGMMETPPAPLNPAAPSVLPGARTGTDKSP